MDERPAKRQRVDYSNSVTEDINSYRRAVIDVFVIYYDRIRSGLEGTMESFASKMYSNQLISSQFMEFSRILEQFKAGFESCGSILEIQQRYKCFTDILLDLSGPVGVAGKEIEEKLSKLIVSYQIEQEVSTCNESHHIQENIPHDQWQPYDRVLTNILIEVENADNLNVLANKLQRKFDLLVMEVKNALIVNNIDLNDVKGFISQKLHNVHIEEEQAMAEYRQNLYRIREMASLFYGFLLKYYFISYLNYILLKDISKLAKDESIASQFEEYEKSYVKLISTAKFRDIMSAFYQNPHLKPTAPIGLPTIVFRLNDLWQDKTLFDFVRSYIQGFTSFELMLLKELKDNCIIIAYAVFPSILSDVLEYLKSSNVQQKFQEMGVRVELPEDPGRNKVVQDYSPRYINNGFLNGKPTIDEVRDHVTVDTMWYKFGELLKLDTIDLDSIDQQYKDNDSKVVKMFELWLSTNSNAIRREIINALLNPAINASAIVQKYTKALVEIQKEVIIQLFQNHSGMLSKLTLPMEIVQILYKEEVISKETFNEIEKSGGLLANGPLRALSSIVSDDPNHLRAFCTVLLQSEETVRLANAMFKDYDSIFPQSPAKQSSTAKDVLATTILSTTSTTTQKLHTSFDQMRENFRKLIGILAPLISKGIPSLRILKIYLGRFFRELKPQLDIAGSFDDVMDIVEKKCTIINICCLEAIVMHYDIKEAKSHLSAYESEIDTFCQVTKLRMCINESFVTGVSSLLKCETVQFVLDWEPDKHTLGDVRDFLVTAFNDISKRVQVIVVKTGNFIIVTCYAPQHVMDILLKEAEKSFHSLIKIGLLKVTLGYYTIWNESTIDNELRGLVEEVTALEKEVASEKMLLTEKDQEIQNLKLSLENQSSTVTLSEKIKLLEKMCKAKTLEIEKLTMEKVSEEKQEEMQIMDEEIMSLSLQLMQKEEKITQLMENMKGSMYTGITCYEKKGNNDWIVRFYVVKDIDALSRYLNKEFQHVDKDEPVFFNSSEGFIELVFDQVLPLGWTVIPMVKPCKLLAGNIDKFGSSQDAIPSSCQFKVCATDSPYTCENLVYTIEVKGTDPSICIKINLTRQSVLETPSLKVSGIAVASENVPIPRVIDDIVNPEIARRTLVRCTDIIVESRIDPIVLARKLYSTEVISEEVYRTVKDKATGDSSQERLDLILDTLKDQIKYNDNVIVFKTFLYILKDDSLKRDELADIIISKYKELEFHEVCIYNTS